MGKVIAGMTMSLDGFVAHADGNAGRLYPDFAARQGSSYMQDTIAETGTVIMGRRMFALGDPDSWVDTCEFQAPILVLTHHPPSTPPKQEERLIFTFVTDGVVSAVAQATAAAGDKAVQVVGGPRVIQELLRAKLVDELNTDIVPVLLSAGLRLFEDGDLGSVSLETLGVETVAQRTDLRFRVAR